MFYSKLVLKTTAQYVGTNFLIKLYCNPVTTLQGVLCHCRFRLVWPYLTHSALFRLSSYWENSRWRKKPNSDPLGPLFKANKSHRCWILLGRLNKYISILYENSSPISRYSLDYLLGSLLNDNVGIGKYK